MSQESNGAARRAAAASHEQELASVPLEDLRSVVRDVLRDVLPGLVAPAAVEEVRIADDVDLAAFVARILDLAADAPTLDRLRSGRHRFRLAAVESRTPPLATPGLTAASGHQGSPGHRVERGAVTERHVRAAEASGAVLVLGSRAVLTPLARDRARAAGVEIVRDPAVEAPWRH